MTTTTTLPDTPSELIRLAIKDARSLDRRAYKASFQSWHVMFDLETRCSVCFAGAVIAGTLGAEPSQRLDPFCYDEDTRGKLRALDFFRDGAPVDALIRLGFARSVASGIAAELPEPVDRTFNSWIRFDSFLTSMGKIADDLERQGW